MRIYSYPEQAEQQHHTGRGWGRSREPGRVGGKPEEWEEAPLPSPGSRSQMDTAQNHTHQRQSEYCGDSPGNHREDLLPGCKKTLLLLGLKLTFSYYNQVCTEHQKGQRIA